MYIYVCIFFTKAPFDAKGTFSVIVQYHLKILVLQHWFEEEDIGNILFQQDGATCYTAKATLDVLRHVFEDRIISRRADVVWPPRICDLTPYGYYLWEAIKDNVTPTC